MITSKSNQQMKYIQNLQKKSKVRYEENVFVVEGIKMCLEAPKEWVESMYVSDSFLMDPKQEKRIAEYNYEVVADPIFKMISDTMTPQGILAIIKMPRYSPEQILEQRVPHLLILDSIQDPGNLGTMIRTGEGAGVTGVIMNRTTVDLFHPKTIRSTMGSIYRIPFFITEDLKDTIERIKKAGIVLYAAHLKGKSRYDKMDYKKPTGFLIGNEGNGLSEEIAALADSYIRIPMDGQVESLNAAMAAGILMYEVRRQRGEEAI